MALNRGNSLLKFVLRNKNITNLSAPKCIAGASLLTVKNYSNSSIDELKTLNPSKYQKVKNNAQPNKMCLFIFLNKTK